VKPACVIAALAAGLACAACGSSAPTSSTRPAATTGSAIGLPSTPPSGGKQIFAHDCQACHSLIGNESLRKQGGDLIGIRLTYNQLLSFTRVMPTPPLTAKQLEAVVDYVLRADQRGRGS
jgi:mono/diheme cytochrome c family protein